MADLFQVELPLSRLVAELRQLPADQRNMVWQAFHQQELEELAHQLRQIRTENNLLTSRVNAAEHKAESALDLRTEAMRRISRKLTPTQIGANLIPHVSGHRVNKLLKIIGVLQKTSPAHDETHGGPGPYSQWLRGKNPPVEAKVYDRDYQKTTYVFSYQWVINRLEKWLDDSGEREAWDLSSAKDERDVLIDLWFEQYVFDPKEDR